MLDNYNEQMQQLIQPKMMLQYDHSQLQGRGGNRLNAQDDDCDMQHASWLASQDWNEHPHMMAISIIDLIDDCDDGSNQVKRQPPPYSMVLQERPATCRHSPR